MKLEKTYQSILDDSFRRRFPDWDQVPALDPMKAFTEAVSGSLAEIERRQVRLTDVLVNSLPAFFGMERKGAQPEQFLFHMKEAQSLRNIHIVNAGSSFSLMVGTKTVHATNQEPLEIFPVDNFKTTTEGNQVSLRFSLRGGCERLKLFVTSAAEKDIQNFLDSASLTTLSVDGKRETWDADQLAVEDSSFGGTENGYLVVRPRPGASLFPRKAADYELTLGFHQAFQGTEILFNVAPLSLRLVSSQAKLGALKGEPWEQLALPEEILEIPREVKIAMVNQSLVLHRVEIDLLKIRTAEPERFENSFFYEPFSHSLIFPGAHRLLEKLNHETTVTCENFVATVPKNLNLKEARFDAGDLRIVIEGARPLFELRPFIARENPLDYLKRFYNAVRFFSSSQSLTPGVLQEELQTELAGAHPLVRMIEVEVNANEKRVDVHVLTHTALKSREKHLPDCVVEAVGEKLSQRVPLDYQYRLIPFRKVPVEVQTQVSISLAPQRAGVVTDGLLQDRMEETMQNVLSPERLASGTALSKSRLAQAVQKQLCTPVPDHTHLRETEIDTMSLLVRQLDQGTYLENIARRAGEVFELQFTTEIDMLAAQSTVLTQRSAESQGQLNRRVTHV